ncbi:MAG TPA: serine/threonine-protein kinase, partial [Sandaracinaceae bacterium]
MNEPEREQPRLSLTDVFGVHDTAEGTLLAEHDPLVTVRARPSTPSDAPLPARERLEEASRAVDPSARIERLRELGRGGMGVVYLAEQRSLGRAVAVKELREDVRSRLAQQALLQEAWVLGSIEHPNVVPVYDLMLDESGAPRVVLKRIEGECWTELIADEARVRERYGAKDVLEWHLSVLVSVCNAVSFAHSRGIIHRDIKPDNVMIGRFGEVYLVDWGVAVALFDDGTGRFPLVTDVRSFAGTPRYMAPEMLGGRGASLGVHTDVYLLGATLFHVLAGRAPHTGENVMEIATRLAAEDPELPDGVPPALARICATAMARDPRARYPSADAFKQAIQDYLRHRDAMLMADVGRAKLAELIELASEVGDDPDAHRLRMFNLYSEARLGFRLARRMWPESGEASDGLHAATETMIAYLLDRGDVASATTLVGQLERPLARPLAERYEAAKRADDSQRRRIAELEALGREHDPRVGRRPRFVAYAALAALFVITGLVGHVRHPWETHEGLLAVTAGQLAALGLVGWAARRSLLSSALNRRLYAALGVAFAGKLLVHAATFLLDRPPAHGYALVGRRPGSIARPHGSKAMASRTAVLARREPRRLERARERTILDAFGKPGRGPHRDLGAERSLVARARRRIGHRAHDRASHVVRLAEGRVEPREDRLHAGGDRPVRPVLQRTALHRLEGATREARADERGLNGRDADAERAELEPHHVGERLHRELARAVHAHERKRHDAGDARDVDDAALPGAPHRRRERARDRVQAVDVHRELLAPSAIVRELDRT